MASLATFARCGAVLLCVSMAFILLSVSVAIWSRFCAPVLAYAGLFGRLGAVHCGSTSQNATTATRGQHTIKLEVITARAASLIAHVWLGLSSLSMPIDAVNAATSARDVRHQDHI